MSSFYPDSIGGAELSTLYIINSLKNDGWNVEIIAGATFCENSLGFPCWRGDTSISRLKQIIDRRLKEDSFDIIACQNIGASPWKQYLILNYLSKKAPEIFYFVRCADFLMKFRIPIPKKMFPIANSPVSAEMLQRLTKKKVKLIYPLINREQVFSEEKIPGYITFINPIPEKGVKVAIEVAKKLPENKFLFVMGKWLNRNYGPEKPWIKTIYNLPNVEIMEPQMDMRGVYKITKILLVPSQFIDMSPRVIIEAHINSIPVVASSVGGIPGMIGKGGILINPKEDVNQYIEALRKLQTDLDYYKKLSSLALENSKREEFNSCDQVTKLKKYFLESLNNSSSRSSYSLV